MKKFILLSFIVVIMFVACSERSDLPVQKVQSPAYTDPYSQDMVMRFPVGGVLGFIANSDLIVYGTAESIVGPVNYVTSDAINVQKSGKLIKFNIDEILYLSNNLKAKIKNGSYIDWVVDCPVADGINCGYEVYSGDKYILFLREEFVNNNSIFMTFNLAYGRISDATQRAGTHPIFANKTVSEIKQEVLANINKVYRISELDVRKYEFSIEDIERYGSITGIWRDYIKWENLPDAVKNALNDVYDGVIGFCRKNTSGHFELNDIVGAEGYVYFKIEWKFDYDSKGCTIFAIKDLPSGTKAVDVEFR